MRLGRYLIGTLLLGLAGAAGTLAVKAAKALLPTKGRKIASYLKPRRALLVVDIQEDFTGEQNGKAPLFPESGEFLRLANRVIEGAVKEDMLVVYIGHEWPDNMMSRVLGRGRAVSGSEGAKFDSRLTVVSSHYFAKCRADAFSNRQLEELLVENQVDEIFIMGLDAAYCVYRTAQGALNRDYKVHIVDDAILTVTKKTRQELVEKYRKAGITTVESKWLIRD